MCGPKHRRVQEMAVRHQPPRLHLRPPLPLPPKPSPPLTTGPDNPNTVAIQPDDEDSPLSQPQTLHFPFPNRGPGYGSFRLVGSVDGLVLLSDDIHGFTYDIILWNPSIHKSVTLPTPRFNHDDYGPHTFILGFGLDSATGDYKVVRLVYFDDEDFSEPTSMVEVYSLRAGSWRTVISSDVDYKLSDDRDWNQCFLHGAVHWIGYRGEPGEDHFEMGILLFDVGTEKFEKMALPQAEVAGSKSPVAYSVSVIGGLLSVFVDHRLHTNVWVKKDYYANSWIKIASLDLQKYYLVEARLDLRKVCKGISGGGGAVDCTHIQVPPKVLWGPSFLDNFVFSYPESLVLLDKEDKVVQETDIITQLQTDLGLAIEENMALKSKLARLKAQCKEDRAKTIFINEQMGN